MTAAARPLSSGHSAPGKETPADVAIAPRDIRFDLSGAGRHWMGGDPVASAVFNALSLTFPDGERLFMDAVRNFRGEVSGKLADEVRGFIAQEAIHSREHHLLNTLIDRSRYPVAEVEALIRERIEFSRSQGPMGMLVSTIALEHFTAMMADVFADDPDLFAGVDPQIDRMWRWHALEETEHKAVAYDVFLVATKTWPPLKRYMRRCIAMALISYLFTRNIARYAARLLEADGYEPKAALAAVNGYLWRKPGLFRKGWRIWLSWFRPGFHPWDRDNRDLIARWRAEFDAVPTAA
jgi:uncharacterized protein